MIKLDSPKAVGQNRTEEELLSGNATIRTRVGLLQYNDCLRIFLIRNSWLFLLL